MGLAACLRVPSITLPLLVVFSWALLPPAPTAGEALPLVALMDAILGVSESQSKPRCGRDAGRWWRREDRNGPASSGRRAPTGGEVRRRKHGKRGRSRRSGLGGEERVFGRGPGKGVLWSEVTAPVRLDAVGNSAGA